MSTTLPTEPRASFDLDAWRRRMEAKSAQARHFEYLEHAAAVAAHRPTRRKAKTPREPRPAAAAPRTATPRPAAAPRPQPTPKVKRPAVRPCAGCGRPTRPQHTTIEDHPGTVLRSTPDRCATCVTGGTPRAVREPIRPCTGCGRMTRPSNTPLAAAPGAIVRVNADICRRCADHGGTSSDPASARGRVATDRIVELYVDEDLSADAVAQRVGLSAPAVLNRLRAAGVPIRPRGYRRPSQQEA